MFHLTAFTIPFLKFEIEKINTMKLIYQLVLVISLSNYTPWLWFTSCLQCYWLNARQE